MCVAVLIPTYIHVMSLYIIILSIKGNNNYYYNSPHKLSSLPSEQSGKESQRFDAVIHCLLVQVNSFSSHKRNSVDKI